jgi:hypothetical protein
MIAALYVQKEGCYAGLPGVDLWDIDRDARSYAGPWSVVAHPPCQLWTKFARVNFARWGGEHNRPGNDGGCFESALAAVRTWGGVLEHPATSYAWGHFKLMRPKPNCWTFYQGDYVCEVWQSAYGHSANKATWLLYRGMYPPPPLRWERPEGLFQIGRQDQRGKSNNKPTIAGKKASATPPEFRDLLISIAAGASMRRAA